MASSFVGAIVARGTQVESRRRLVVDGLRTVNGAEKAEEAHMMYIELNKEWRRSGEMKAESEDQTPVR